MKKIRFLFRKAKGLNGISSWTWVLGVLQLDFGRLKYNYSHCEVWFPDGRCFSARADGVSFKPASEILSDTKEWDYIEVKISDWQHRLIEAAEQEVGKEYDYKGLWGFFWLWNIEDEAKRYCSEVCAYLAQVIGLVDVMSKQGDYRISPRRLASVMAKKYGQPVCLWRRQ